MNRRPSLRLVTSPAPSSAARSKAAAIMTRTAREWIVAARRALNAAAFAKASVEPIVRPGVTPVVMRQHGEQWPMPVRIVSAEETRAAFEAEAIYCLSQALAYRNSARAWRAASRRAEALAWTGLDAGTIDAVVVQLAKVA